MKRLLISFLIVMCFFSGLKAQWGRGLYDARAEPHDYLTLSLGPAFCYSDAQGSFGNQLNLKNHDVSLGYRRLYSNNFGFKAVLNYSSFTGNDDGSDYGRRYTYKSNVMQASFQAEYTVLIGQSYNRVATNALYGFFGAGVLRCNADLKGPDNSDYIRYIDYKYKKISYAPVIPFGFGYQYYVNYNFLIGFEVNGSYPFSDYIDGFKPPLKILQNGTKVSSKSNDVMGGISITISYLFGSEYLKRN